jgi:myo-inositol-1(or 4)-monophosphatase
MDPYDFIIQKIQETGSLLMRLREEKFETGIKGGNARDIVTSVDIEVNNFLIAEITKAFPDHRIYSEEGGDIQNSSEQQWTIDPIDGSANFSRSIPHFAVCVGLLERGVPSAGAVYNPVTRELFSFKKGSGAFLNGKPIHVSTISELSEAQVFLHAGRKQEMWDWGGEAYKKLLQSVNKTKNFSAIALDTCFVAAGRIEANIYGTITTVLDLAPALGILKEAGGVVCDEKGEPLSFSATSKKIFMANNQTTLNQLREIL